jgi:hypothetical protein
VEVLNVSEIRGLTGDEDMGAFEVHVGYCIPCRMGNCWKLRRGITGREINGDK